MERHKDFETEAGPEYRRMLKEKDERIAALEAELRAYRMAEWDRGARPVAVPVPFKAKG